MNRLTTPFIDQGGGNAEEALAKFQVWLAEIKAHFATQSALFPTGPTAEAEVLAYHAELERAFSLAASGLALPIGTSTLEGRQAAVQARELLLELVILPYNRLLGLRKNTDTVLGLAPEAESVFRLRRNDVVRMIVPAAEFRRPTIQRCAVDRGFASGARILFEDIGEPAQVGLGARDFCSATLQ